MSKHQSVGDGGTNKRKANTLRWDSCFFSIISTAGSRSLRTKSSAAAVSDAGNCGDKIAADQLNTPMRGPRSSESRSSYHMQLIEADALGLISGVHSMLFKVPSILNLLRCCVRALSTNRNSSMMRRDRTSRFSSTKCDHFHSTTESTTSRWNTEQS